MSHQYCRKLGLVALLAMSMGALHAEPQENLLAALGKGKLTLLDGVRQANKDGGVALSAKFEFDDAGKLSLSVYSAGKGLGAAPDENILQELSGSPEQSQWKPEVEVFKDAPHIARSSEQLTLLSLTRVSLADLIAKAQKAQPGTVYSVTPGIKQHKPVAQVLVANGGKVTELTYNLLNGALMDTRHQ
ncbi:hypothetical protein [Janthinobacterium sp. GW458P]|uniref:hypothetical protein n=1 Tax=Janthinobacterium sp. GW458P TaxID=1981504 RepID=UPI0011208257|nr:hypothetical protein [Janthinobacterium sp. GW458P]MBE3024100.1 hypothetical protein [Janthinobacterium sp. GW458P]